MPVQYLMIYLDRGLWNEWDNLPREEQSRIKKEIRDGPLKKKIREATQKTT